MKTDKEIDQDEEAVIEQYGATVEIDRSALDRALPRFHKLDREHSYLDADTVTLPVIHAVKFCIPCPRCYPTDA